MKLANLAVMVGVALTSWNLKPAQAFSVCGLSSPESMYKTENHLVTICLGEASFQMVVTFHDGTGYQVIPVNQEGAMFRGTDGERNFIIDQQTFVIGIDGEPPIRERVLEHQ